jgi:hypothetical protein
LGFTNGDKCARAAEVNWASPSRAEQVLTVRDRVAMSGQLTDAHAPRRWQRLMAAITAIAARRLPML